MSDMPQYIRTPAGDDMVVLSLTDYEALLANRADEDEDEADAALYAARKAALASGDDAVLPAEVDAALLSGDRLLKALRRWRGMTQQQLAAAAGLAQGHISAIECGEKSGSLEAATAIAAALDVPLGWIR